METQKEEVDRQLNEALTTARGLPHSRETSLVITKIEEALLWLNKEQTK